MKKVAIVLNLKDEEQAHFFEIELRKIFPEGVISYAFLPDTQALYKNDSHFKKLVKNVKSAQRLRDNYINEYN